MPFNSRTKGAGQRRCRAAKNVWKGRGAGRSDEEKADAHNADDGTDNFARGYTLVEKPCGRGDDEYGREGEERLGDAGGGVHGGKERHAYAHKGTEDGGTKDTPHGFAVADGMAQLVDSVFVEKEKQQGEACQPHGGTYHGGGKGDADVEGHRNQGVGQRGVEVETFGNEGGIVVLKSYFAQHQPKALAYSSHTGVGYSFFGEAELEMGRMVVGACHGVAFGEDGHAYARKGYAHAQNGQRTHLLANKEASHDGCGGGGEGHKKLTETRADIDIALHEAVVANHIAHYARQEEPEPSRAVGKTGPRHPHDKPKGEDKQCEGHDHAHHIERQGAHAFGRHLGKKGGDSPREGYKKRYGFAYKQL